jgi:erythromycin esterase-like protein
MIEQAQQQLINTLNKCIQPLEPQTRDYSNLLQKIGDARFVFIGEATHGSEEFYQSRIRITQRLIQEKGFMAIAIEGDWPDAYTIHRYIQGQLNYAQPKEALADFNRFPTWMWRNTTMPPFLQWLREHNAGLPSNRQLGFYGLDLYSLNASMQAVIAYLMKLDPQAAQRARKRYACFDHTSLDPQTYGYLTNIGIKKSCIHEAVAVLVDLQRNAFEYLQDGLTAQDDYFFATQNARLVKDAETYYRSMFEGRASSWNIRDNHMAETLNILAEHLENRFNERAKIIIWAHNSHIGDARATEMADQGEINIGQLIREQHDGHTCLIGFSTYQGSVTAASEWGNPPQFVKINPGLKGSYEEIFHQLQYQNFLLDLVNSPELEHFLKIPRLQRAIGVIYRPESERYAHYFFTHLTSQFDFLIHFDKTTAVIPLDN